MVTEQDNEVKRPWGRHLKLKEELDPGLLPYGCPDVVAMSIIALTQVGYKRMRRITTLSHGVPYASDERDTSASSV
jgi:hypothetical protein